LKSLNVVAGFISTSLNGSIFKEVKRNIFNFKWHAITKFSTKSLNIYGFNIVESTGIYRSPSFLNLYNYEKVRAGIRSFRKYVEIYGMPDIIHAHSRFLDSVLLAKKINDLFGIPYVITEHSTKHQRKIVHRKEYVQYRYAVNASKKWIVVSESLGEIIEWNLSKMNLRLNKSFTVVPNVVDPNYKFIQHIQEKEFIFLNIASLDQKKNHELLLRSFDLLNNHFKNISLRIGGEGVLENDLKSLVRKLSLTNVIFLGKLSREQVQKEISKSNVFVLSSNEETFGVVLIESLAIGRPVIATKCGGPEYIINSKNGLLIDKNNEIQLFNAMKEVLENYNSYNLNQISVECDEKYGPNTIGKQLIEIYREALN
jgi:glycosyltransferase involved in cell wall biosynthesis